MDGDLRAMLGRTLKAKSYWLWRDRKPTNLGAAMDMLGHPDINTLVQLHRRLSARGLWGSIQTITGLWTTSSLGINYNGTDMTSAVSGSRDFCKDTSIGQIYHSGKECWRETVPAGTAGLHVCMPAEVHIDPHQAVDPTTRQSGIQIDFGNFEVRLAEFCAISVSAWLSHMGDVWGGRPVNVFKRHSNAEDTVAAQRSRAEGHRSLQPAVVTQVTAMLDAQDARLAAIKPTLRGWAIQGLEGGDSGAQIAHVQAELTVVEQEISNVDLELERARRRENLP